MIRTQRQRRSRRNDYTLKLSRQLRERAHFDQEQAEGLAETLAEAFHEQIATKTDLQTTVKDLQSEFMPVHWQVFMAP